MDQSLKGEKIVVVGGAGLLGSVLAEEFCIAGAEIVIADVDLGKASTLAEEIQKKTGTKPCTREVSIVSEDSVKNLIDFAQAKMGRITGLLNTAYPRNRNYGKRLEDVDYNNFCENVDLHLGGYFVVSKYILEYFKKNGGGNLLNMSSIYGVVAPRFEIYDNTAMTMPVEYAAIKAALIHLTRYFAKYYSGCNIKVNCLSIGGLLDKQPSEFLMGYRQLCCDKGMLDPQDIAGIAVALFSKTTRYINGQDIILDDGFTL